MTQYLWAVDGVPLESVAFNVVVVSGGTGAPLRGEDTVLSGVPGALLGARVEDSTSLTLGMWIMGDDGAAVDEAGRAVEFERRWRELRRMLRPDGLALRLSKTWTDDLGEHTATAVATVDEVPQLRRVNAYQGQLTVDFHLPDPWFYGDEQEVLLQVGVPAEVVNAGDAITTTCWLDVQGQLANARVSNATPEPDVWVQLGSAVAAGDAVVLDVEDALAVRASDGANLIGSVTHSGSRAWFGLRRGVNQVELTATSGAGQVLLRWRERWS